jgi:signal transduction histidine kinase
VRRQFSTRRITLIYILVAGLLIALLAGVFLARSFQQQQELAEQRLDALQLLLAAAGREIPADRFAEWLALTDFTPWAGPVGDIVWFRPPTNVHWSRQPLSLGALPPHLQNAILNLATATGAHTRHLRMQENNRDLLVRLQRIDPDLPEAGLLLLRVPAPRFFAGSQRLPLASLLVAFLLAVTFLLYQFTLRFHLRRVISNSQLEPLVPAPGPNEALDVWTRRYVTTTSRRLAEERGLFDSLFDILQDGILFLDAENRILRANAAAGILLGADPGDLIGVSLPEVARQPALNDLADSIRSSGTYQTGEFFLPTISGSGHVAGIPLQVAPEDRSTHIMLVMRDLSQVRRLESAGEEYATNVSHELKTPLTLVLGYTETLLSHADIDPGFRERSLQTIQHHTKRIIRIIDDLLRLAWLRNEAGKSGIPRSPVSVPAIINDAAEICREWARAAGIEIETHVPADLVWHLNSGLIEEALVNLIKNAILYALTGPVEVCARLLESGLLEITVVDRGPGLKPEDAQRIFERFYRADKSRARSSGGSGLGLPIVQQIVEAHQGMARVETAPGEGCTFILEIPPPPPAAEEPPPTPPDD